MNSHILQLLSPAKLNLFLHITGRRNDGYHQIQTFFQLLDLGDQMSFSSNNEGTISLDCPKLDIPVEDNLIYQAAIALKSHSGSVKGAHILQPCAHIRLFQKRRTFADFCNQHFYLCLRHLCYVKDLP